MTRAELEIKRILSNKVRTDNLDKKALYQKLSEPQLKTLRKYKSYLENKPSPRGGKIKPTSIRNALWSLLYLGVYLKKPYEKATKKDLVNYIKSINGKSDYTTSRWKVEIRSFYKWIYGIKKPHEFPEVVDDELLVPERPKNKVTPKDLLTKDELKMMVEACFHDRTKAMLMCIAEGGLRAGEVISTNVGSVEFDDIGAKLWVEKSKSKERYVRLIDAAPYLERWLHEHPNKDNPKAPLFPGLSAYKGKRLNINGVNQAIQRAAERAGIKKRIHTHKLRHYAVTNISKQGMDIVMNARRHGITPNTIERVYLHYSDQDVDDAYIRTKGASTDEQKVLDEEEKKKLAPKKCQSCGKLNPFSAHYCEACNRPIDLKTFVELDEQRKKELEDFKKDLLDMFTEQQKQLAIQLKEDYGLDELMEEKQKRSAKKN